MKMDRNKMEDVAKHPRYLRPPFHRYRRGFARRRAVQKGASHFSTYGRTSSPRRSPPNYTEKPSICCNHEKDPRLYQLGQWCMATPWVRSATYLIRGDQIDTASKKAPTTEAAGALSMAGRNGPVLRFTALRRRGHRPFLRRRSPPQCVFHRSTPPPIHPDLDRCRAGRWFPLPCP